MPWYALRLRIGMGESVCAVEADEVARGDTAVTFWNRGSVVYQAPVAALLELRACGDVAEAREAMADLRARSGSGRLGQEYLGIRPAAGGTRQVGTVVEQVVAVVEGAAAVKPK